ncbi:MAG: metal ABC transporter permease [Melioribacteraceae bacterium]|nr:metal ABC transporter permease [Melioribacteraceae bacterium]
MEWFLEIISDYTFVQNAIIAGILSSIACGVTGTFVVVKKISYIGGGIAHAVMGGLGIAYFLGINPLLGALVFAVFAAFVIGLVKLKLKESEDTIISALWAIGMATGVIFAYLTPGYNVDLLSFLFGNILMVSSESLWILLILDVVILLVVFIFYRQLVYVCFDEEYAALRGIKVDYVYIMLLVMVALTIVILVQTVGLILVIALLTLPSAIAKLFSKNIAKMMLISVLLITSFFLIGFYFSLQANLPSGASIILIAGAGYLVAFAINRIKYS